MTLPPIHNPSEPRFDVPEPNQPRVYAGWAVLAILFALMIVMQMNAYLSRGETPGSKYRKAINELQIAVQMKQAAKAIGAPNSGDLNTSIENVVKQVEAEAATDEIAARVFAAAKNELGEPIPENVLAKLKTSEEPRDKFFAEVFGAKKIEKERAQQIETELKDGGFISKLATVVAYEKAGDNSRREQLAPVGKAFLRFGLLAVSGFAVVAGVVFLILFLVSKAQGRLPALGFRMPNMTLREADLLALRCAQVLAVFLAVPIVGALIGQSVATPTNGPLMKLLVGGILVVAIFLLFKYPVGERKFTLADIGIHKENLGKNIAWGVGAALANLPLLFIAFFVGQKLFFWLPSPEHPVTSELAGGTGVLETIAIFVGGAVVAPLVEEIMFRGTLAPALSRVMKSSNTAILLQGLLFASIHPTGVPAWLALATIGSVSGFLYRQTNSLVPSITMHAVHNFGTLLLAMTVFS